MSLYEVAPDPAWTLDQWRIACGNPSANELIEIGLSLRDVELVQAVVGRWRTGTVHSWISNHIAQVEDARAMIAVLREAARRRGIRLFDGDRLRSHADIFMRSPACRPGGFTPLDEAQLADIAGRPVPQVDPRFDDADLMRKVYPPPPVIPYGRENDLSQVLRVLGRSVVTVIVSDPGNGKTTLAWHASRRAVLGGLVAAMDWNTDKRMMVTATGEERRIDTIAPLKFESIITSAVRRFGWHELRRAPDSQLSALAAQKFAEGRYLLVVDNLETVPQAAQMVADLRNLLEPRGEFAPIASRAIITSRVPVEDVPGVHHIYIEGLALEPATTFVRALEEDGGHSQRVTDSQVERLWALTKGNPLLIQIALTRAAQQNARFDDVLNDLDSGAGFLVVFERVFGPLIKAMTDENPHATFLAVYAALLPDLTLNALWTAWERELHDGEPAFSQALATVVRCGVLRPIPGSSGEYAIHPVIRRYLRAL